MADLIQQLASVKVARDTATTRMLSMIHKKVAEHRDALGFPAGGPGYPQFYVSDDLCFKFGMAMRLLTESQVDLSAAWVVELARNFVRSYDEPQSGLRHSSPKSSALKVLQQYEAIAGGRAA